MHTSDMIKYLNSQGLSDKLIGTVCYVGRVHINEIKNQVEKPSMELHTRIEQLYESILENGYESPRKPYTWKSEQKNKKKSTLKITYTRKEKREVQKIAKPINKELVQLSQHEIELQEFIRNKQYCQQCNTYASTEWNKDRRKYLCTRCNPVHRQYNTNIGTYVEDNY